MSFDIPQTVFVVDFNWSQREAIDMVKKIEAICPQYGCHVALTGGLLYKDGPRKDCDILFYRIRQVGEIDEDGLWNTLENSLGFVKMDTFGWLTKALYNLKKVDVFFPERKYIQPPAGTPRLGGGTY